MNNLRKFQNTAEYEAAQLIKPAVSLIANTDDVFFDPKEPILTFSGLTVYYYITDISQPTELFNGGGGSGSGSGSGSGGDLPSAMIIDGTVVEVTNTYQFSTTGEHIVQYSFAVGEEGEKDVPESFLQDNNLVIGVEIGNWFTGIRQYAFDACSMSSVTIPDSVIEIGDAAFSSCIISSVTIPDSVTSIGGSAFMGCYELSSVTIPDSVIEIGSMSFQDCHNLSSVTIGNGLTSIEGSMFNGCFSLSSVTIGSGVTNIGLSAFGGCEGLSSVTINAVTPPSLDDSEVFVDCTELNAIYVPAQSVNAYMTASYWSEYADRIQAIS